MLAFRVPFRFTTKLSSHLLSAYFKVLTALAFRYSFAPAAKWST